MQTKGASIETIGNPVAPPTRTSAYAAASAILHILLIAVLIHQRAAWIAPLRLPGSDHGRKLLLTWSPGRAPIQVSAPNPKTKPKQAQSTVPLPATPTPEPEVATTSPNSSAPASQQPDSSAGADALGSGNINIALVSFFPTPKPDLSVLPRGTRGDVILDILIDSTGRIADIKIASGLGHGIDETVIATVQQWTFHPATKDGQPIASEQELHFHYEKA